MQNTPSHSDDFINIFEFIQRIQSKYDMRDALNEIIHETPNLIPESYSSIYLTDTIFNLYEDTKDLLIQAKDKELRVYRIAAMDNQVSYQDLIIETHERKKPFTILQINDTGNLNQSIITIPLVRNKKSFGVFVVNTSATSPFSLEFSATSVLSLICLCIANTASEIIEDYQNKFESMANEEKQETLLMSLAHAINTPLTAILADSENLSKELASHPELQQVAKNNLEQVSRLQLLTETIMGILTKDKIGYYFQKVDISEPLRDACDLFAAEASFKGCDIIGPTHVGKGNFPVIEISRFDMEIAFKNIIHNAIKYSFRPPSGKNVHGYVRVWGEWSDKTKKYYEIKVQNYGVGISQQEIESNLIFQPYYRGINANDRRRTGTGIGLAHARQVIEDIHGGKIDITSISQGGTGYLTTLTITLPVQHELYKITDSNTL